MRLRARISILIAVLLVIGAGVRTFADGSTTNGSSENSDCSDGVIHSALGEISRKDFEQGRLLLKNLTGSDCSLKPAAMLLIADSYYREGRSDGFANAEAEYTRWLELFPEQELVPLVLIKIAELHLRQVNGRNAEGHAAMANIAILKLQQLYPHLVDATVQKHSWITEELLAEHQLRVARFYLEVRGASASARIRCLEILEKFPRYSKVDSALWYLALADEQIAQTEEPEANINEAIASYERIAGEHGGSEYRERAIDKLKYYGRGVPKAAPETEPKSQERSARVALLSDIDGYILRIAGSGVLLNDQDEVDGDALKTFLKDRSAGPASAITKQESN